jgi:D-sedoheptulose 7-phosphate isomerase
VKNNSYFSTVTGLLPQDLTQINVITSLLYNCLTRGNTVWLIGNGGSASTADHFEVDLSYVRLSDTQKTIRAKSLSSNSSMLTAIGNDIGFENVFAHQISRQGQAGDICFAISASGNSENLVRAFEVSEELGISTIGLLGFDGGILHKKADQSFLVSSTQGLYGPVEDTHLAICHFIASELKNRIFGGTK